jgi:hypothetical protein
MADVKDGKNVSQQEQTDGKQHSESDEVQRRVIDRNNLAMGVNLDPAVRKAIEATRHLSLDPSILRAMESARSIKMDPIIGDLLAISASQAEIARALRQSNLFGEFKRTAALAAESMIAIREQFRRPEIVEGLRLFERTKRDVAQIAAPLIEQGAELQRAMASMTTPWLNTSNSLHSMLGFAELQGIGTALTRMPAFDETLTANLRAGLGDWRDEIALPPGILENTGARSEFYEERGFDPALTAFPADAFAEAVSVAELNTPAPVFVENYTIPAQDDEEEAGFERTNAAHDRLLRFETMLRRFIDDCMTRELGQTWTNNRIPDDIRQRWIEKRKRAEEKGEKCYSLIAYADFTDYEKIICMTGNWNGAFKSVFRRAEFVRESFQRLYPIRLCTMHARLITADDELYLFVEVKRFLKVIDG